MKVLYLTNLPSPYRVDFFSELGKYCDLTVLYERRTASDRDEKWVADSEQNFKEIYLNGMQLGADNSCSFKVIKHLNKSYDRIVVGMYSTVTAMIAIMYMKVRKIPFYLSSDGGFIKEESFLKYRVKHFFISSASAWFSSGKITTNYLIHYGAKKNRVYIYPFTSIKENDVLKSPLNLNEKRIVRNKLQMKEEKIVLSVGQFINRKGFDILFKACNELDNRIGFYIVGGKPTPEYLEMKKNMKLNNVHFIDFLSKKELEEYYKAADLFVLPTREDIWGLVVNEAIAYGLPVITTDKCIAGMEIIKNNNLGAIYRVEEFHALKEQIEHYLDKHIVTEDIIHVAKQYTIEKMANSIYDILLEN